MRLPLVFLLSGLGLFLPACAGSGGEGAAQGSAALDDDPDLTAYFASKEFAALSGDVALEVRQVLTAAPGATSRTTMLALFRSPKWLMLGSAFDPGSCPAGGTVAQQSLLDWIKASEAPEGAEAPASVDARTAANVASLKRLLALQDVRNIGVTLASIQSGLAGSKPAYALPSPCTGGGGGSTTKAGGGGSTTTKSGGCSGSTTNKSCDGDAGKPGGSTTRASLEPATGRVKPEARRILDGMLAASAGPTPALAREWDTLRARYQAKLARAAASPLARAIVAEGRRAGSATLARESSRPLRAEAMKFDRAAALVERMIERDVAFSAEAMRVVHSVVADREHGRLRTGGQDVQCGDDRAQAYLPGADVEGAVTALFADVGRAESRVAAPHLAAAFDQRLISIHPFEDANGRTARLMTDWLLLRAGFPPVAGKEAQVAALFWQKQGRSLDRDAHLARITAGMQRTVDLLERAV